MRTHRNAVVGPTKHIAELIKKVFILEGWETFGLTESVTGRGFDHIVIIRPHWQMNGSEVMEFERELQHWHTRLYRDGTLNVI